MENRHETERPASVPFFAHENTVTHMNLCNRRMLIALISVCVTFILTIVIFVHGYTVREKNWLDALSEMQKTDAVEVEDGIHQQPDS